MNLQMVSASLMWPRWKECTGTWDKFSATHPPVHIIVGDTLMTAYQKGYERHPNADILGYVHDDAVVSELSWDRRVLAQFADPDVGVVGFAGALGHGDPKMYDKPYELSQLARRSFMSNMRDAEVHGERFTDDRDVSVLDGFALFVRRELLDEVGGWPQDGRYGYFMYSEWLCCTARRWEYKIRLCGVACDHLGGKSTGLKPDQAFDYEGEHRRLYGEFKDVLPAEVPR